ncbi:MAG: hypothetical protein II972_02210 [Elusimicrobiaceae bacterium]|nr:hypothetical protein [Elusimicrobiaceae bacterium]
MADYNANEYGYQKAGTIKPANELDAKVRAFKATIDLASQASGKTFALFKVPKGYSFITGILNASASLSTATIKIGTAADDDKYRAAAVHTATTPTLFGEQAGFVAGGNATEEEVILTTGTAALPASGKLIITMLFSSVN